MGLAALHPQEDPKTGTKMENFEPLAGSVVVLAYNDLGKVEGISVQVRELSDDKGGQARGILIEVNQDEYHRQASFIDEDEIEELLKGFDALMAVTSNPTKFDNFEVRYKTKGGFQLTAYNTFRGSLFFAVKAGSGAIAQKFNLGIQHLRNIRKLVEDAGEKLRTLNT